MVTDSTSAGSPETRIAGVCRHDFAARFTRSAVLAVIRASVACLASCLPPGHMLKHAATAKGLRTVLPVATPAGAMRNGTCSPIRKAMSSACSMPGWTAELAVGGICQGRQRRLRRRTGKTAVLRRGLRTTLGFLYLLTGRDPGHRRRVRRRSGSAAWRGTVDGCEDKQRHQAQDERDGNDGTQRAEKPARRPDPPKAWLRPQ